MKAALALAWLDFRRLLTKRGMLIFPILCMVQLLMIALALFLFDRSSPGAAKEANFYQGYGNMLLPMASFCAFLMSIMTPSALHKEDIKDKSLHGLLAKPCALRALVAGRILGVLLFVSVFLAVWAVTVFSFDVVFASGALVSTWSAYGILAMGCLAVTTFLFVTNEIGPAGIPFAIAFFFWYFDLSEALLALGMDKFWNALPPWLQNALEQGWEAMTWLFPHFQAFSTFFREAPNRSFLWADAGWLAAYALVYSTLCWLGASWFFARRGRYRSA
jgi:hypothetical protein